MKSVKTSEQKILIIEDDATLASAMKEAFERSKAVVTVVHNSNEALYALGKDIFDYIFVDCMLPGMNGAEFIVKTVRPQYPILKAKVYLMSGIFSDKDYISEAMKLTKAEDFLVKPFDIQNLLKLVQKKEEFKVSDQVLDPRKALYSTFSDPKVTPRKKRKIIEELEEVSGYDLPFIYSLLSETSSSGTLFLYHDAKSVSSITFSDGRIVGVDTDDKTTFIGEMLIQSGYATPNDVKKALEDKSNRRLGHQMIVNNLLSPHAFEFVLEEQMNIRLSRTIVEEKIKLSFSSGEVEDRKPNIDSETLLNFLHDWIASKLSHKWLRELYSLWMNNRIEVTPVYNDFSPIMNMTLLTSLLGLADEIKKGTTLNQLVEKNIYNEEAMFKAIHLLLTKGLIVFGAKVNSVNKAKRIEAIERHLRAIVAANPVEVENYVTKLTGQAEDLEHQISAMSELCGGDIEFDESSHQERYDKLITTLRTKLSEARIASKQSVSPDEKQRIESENKIRAVSLIEEARQLLMTSKFVQAQSVLLKAREIYPNVPYGRLLSIWCKIAQVDHAKKATQLKEIDLEFAQIPAEEKYEYLCPFIQGLIFKAKGDVLNARKSFEKSIALDSSFIVSRRELSLLENQNKKQDIMKMDLKDVVSGFFKKR